MVPVQLWTISDMGAAEDFSRNINDSKELRDNSDWRPLV